MLTAIFVACVLLLLLNVVLLVAVIMTKDVASEARDRLVEVVRALRWEGKSL